jgi:di/tricarboxylate transporter
MYPQVIAILLATIFIVQGSVYMTKKRPQKNKIFYILISLLIPCIIILMKPMGMDINQSIVLGSLILTIIWWGSGIVDRNLASIILLIMFVIFGRTPLKNVFYFPLSTDFILIVCSFLLSQGIVNSKVADRISKYVLSQYCNNAFKLVIMSFVLGILLIFIIPQPFPRVILLSSIYINFLKNQEVSKETRDVLLFSIFVASTCTAMLFINGDIILNYAALKFGSVNMSYIEWAKYMTLPSLLVTILVTIVFMITFKKDIFGVDFTGLNCHQQKKITNQEKIALAITFAVILLWLTESIHHFNAATVALFGTVAMFATKILRIKDFRTINCSLLIFLTAEFSIGKVMTGSGVAYKLSNFLTSYFPDPGSFLYLPFIVMLIMALHMIMGSLITSLSVIIASLLPIVSGYLPAEAIVLITYVSVNIHYLLPFHHVTVMIGFGNGYYHNKHTLKLALGLTILTFISALFIYRPWWKIVGLLN